MQTIAYINISLNLTFFRSLLPNLCQYAAGPLEQRTNEYVLKGLDAPQFLSSCVFVFFFVSSL